MTTDVLFPVTLVWYEPGSTHRCKVHG